MKGKGRRTTLPSGRRGRSSAKRNMLGTLRANRERVVPSESWISKPEYQLNRATRVPPQRRRAMSGESSGRWRKRATSRRERPKARIESSSRKRAQESRVSIVWRRNPSARERDLAEAAWRIVPKIPTEAARRARIAAVFFQRRRARENAAGARPRTDPKRRARPGAEGRRIQRSEADRRAYAATAQPGESRRPKCLFRTIAAGTAAAAARRKIAAWRRKNAPLG